MTFGVEIETVNASIGEVTRALTGAGFDVRESNYSGRSYSLWQVKPDGSLNPGHNDRQHSAEIVSPVLEWGNPDHMRQVERVCRTINNMPNEARVNRSCGLHVHVGARHLTRAEVLGVRDVYTQYEPQIRREVLSPSRWNTERNYDGNLINKEAGWAWSYGAISAPELADHVRYFLESGYIRTLNPENEAARYMAVNLTRLNDIGTVEFRARQGTTNARKILTWVGMAVNMVEQGRQYAATRDMTLGDDLASTLRNQRVDAILESMLSGEFSLAGMATPPASLSQLLRLQGLGG